MDIKNLNLSPLQEIYKEASEMFEVVETQGMKIAEKIKSRIDSLIAEPSNYKNVPRLDQSIKFMHSMILVDTEENIQAFDLITRYSCFINYFILDDEYHVMNKSNYPDKVNRLTYWQNMEIFDSLIEDVKDELRTLLVLWDEIYKLAYIQFLFDTSESHSSLPFRNGVSRLERLKKGSLPLYKWQEVTRA